MEFDQKSAEVRILKYLIDYSTYQEGSPKDFYIDEGIFIGLLQKWRGSNYDSVRDHAAPG